MAISISMVGSMLDSISKVITDLSGYLNLNRMTLLPGNRDTHLSWDLSGVLDRFLVTLSVLLSLALRAGAVTIARLSLSIGLSFTLFVTMSIATMSSNNLGVVSNNSGALVDLSVGSMTLGCESLLTLLDVSGVNNSLAHRAGNLAGVLNWLLVALPVLLVMTFRASGVSWLSLSISITLAISISSVTMSDYL